MREIKFIGNIKKGSDKRNYNYSIFECDFCGREVEKKTKDGVKATYCSHKCYAQNRGVRGPYKESVIISGYKYIQTPNHPNCTKKGYVAEHRLILENKLGRFLEKEEDVHHINMDKLDNTPNNLMVLTQSEHMKLHQSMRRRNKNGEFTVQV